MKRFLFFLFIQTNDGVGILPVVHCFYDDDPTMSEQNISQKRKDCHLLFAVLHTSIVVIPYRCWRLNL